MIKNVVLEVYCHSNGNYWGILCEKDDSRDANARFITAEYPTKAQVVVEGRIRAMQLGWNCFEVEDTKKEKEGGK